MSRCCEYQFTGAADGEDMDTLLTLRQQTTTLNALNNMRLSGILTDMSLKSCDGRLFPVHRTYLCAASTYFMAMFQSEMKENSEPVVELSGISASVLETVLNFLYVGQLPVFCVDTDGTEGLASLWSCADYLLLDRLADHIAGKWMETVKFQDIFHQWKVAEKCNCQVLADELIKRLAINFRHASSQPFYLELSVSQLQSILSHPDLNLKVVDVVVEAILEWIGCGNIERSCHLKDLVSLVNLEKLSSSCFEKLQSNEMFTGAITPRNLNDIRDAVIYRKERTHLHFVDIGFSSVNTFNLELSKPGPAHGKVPSTLFGPTAVASDESFLYVVCASRYLKNYSAVYKYCPFTNDRFVLGHLKVRAWPGRTTACVLNGLLYVLTMSEVYGHQIEAVIRPPVLQRMSLATRDCETLSSSCNVSLSDPVMFECNERIILVAAIVDAHFEVYNPVHDQWTILLAPECIQPQNVFPLNDHEILVRIDRSMHTLNLLAAPGNEWKKLDRPVLPDTLVCIWPLHSRRHGGERDTDFLALNSDSNLEKYDFATSTWRTIEEFNIKTWPNLMACFLHYCSPLP